jgi:DNA adenine methylase
MTAHNESFRAKPFLRWAGGKTWACPRLIELTPSDFNNYHEIFLGGGALFFSLRHKGTSYLNDLNADLINAYRQLKASARDVACLLKTFTNNEDNYYLLRSSASDTNLHDAAKFIFLNRACFNGIYRVNRSGTFNVPYGHNPLAPIYDLNNLLAVEASLKSAHLTCGDFGKTLDRIERNDFVFIDPPYTVAHNNNGFIEYNQKLFRWEDQERLRDFVVAVERKGAKFIVTNAVHDKVIRLYKGIGRGEQMERFSTITSKIKSRRRIAEYLITNV